MFLLRLYQQEKICFNARINAKYPLIQKYLAFGSLCSARVNRCVVAWETSNCVIRYCVVGRRESDGWIRVEQRKRLAVSCQSGSKCTAQTTVCQLNDEKSRLLFLQVLEK